MAGIKFQCSSCEQHLEAPLEAADCALACPNCNSSIRVPSVSETARVGSETYVPGTDCAICQTAISTEDAKTGCPECKAEYHSDCWQENGGCAVYGCAGVPRVEQRRAIEIPISYWGQENKPCPSCNREILAAAVRCRHCGATFSSARPEDSDEFHDRTALRESLPGMKRTVVWIFVFSIVPCLSPIGAVWGVIWYLANRSKIGSLPGVFAAILKIGLAVGLGQCALILFMTALYALKQAH